MLNIAFINSIEIHQFRGIKQLVISDFSNVNLIVGDNNSGKTTLLEAISLLFANPQIGSVKNVITQRTALKPDTSSFYTSFIRTFNMEQSRRQLEISIYADTNHGPMKFELCGKEESVSGEDAVQLSSLSLRQKQQYIRPSAYIPESAKFFKGTAVSMRDGKTAEKSIQCTSLDNGIIGIPLEKEVQYLPSFGHMRYDLLQNIVEDPSYKKLTIDVLRQFDGSISDICYTKADDGTFLETIITRDGASMPFSVYGDGMKKILYILNKMFGATDSVMMIDEIETGLHKKYYDSLFPVIFALAKKLNIQLFIATHSIEVIDAVLKFGNYEHRNVCKETIKVITLKKIDTDAENRIVARNLAGKYVYDNRKVFEFEVRL